MPLCLAVSVFALVSLFALPAEAKEQHKEGKVAEIQVNRDSGFSFVLEDGAAACAGGSGPIKNAGLVVTGGVGASTERANWLFELLLEAKRSGRPVRVVTRPDARQGVPYCRIISLSLL